MPRIPLSNAIDSEVFEILDQLVEGLGPPKNRILESAIEVFDCLPSEIQLILKSNRQEDRKLILDLIGAIKAPPSPTGRGKKGKPPKSG